MKRSHLVRPWIGFFIILVGLCILGWPFLQGMIADRQQEKALIQVEKQIKSYDIAGNDGSKSGKMAEAGPTEEQLSALYDVCFSYNEALIQTEQSQMVDLASVETFDIDTTEYGFTEDTIGTLWVPRLDIELPMYLGSNRDHMAKGVAVFGQTSVPMRETVSANTSIAGHRGWRGTQVFRDIQKIQIGDPIYVSTPWDELVYRVTELKIVTPEDNSWCKIQTGKNMITLMTCHPYTKNYQRYIVFAELTDEAFPNPEQAKKEMADTYDASARMVTDTSGDSIDTVYVDPSSIEPDGTEYGAVWSNVMILAEKQMKAIVIALGVFEVIVAIWLIGRTRKERKQS